MKSKELVGTCAAYCQLLSRVCIIVLELQDYRIQDRSHFICQDKVCEVQIPGFGLLSLSFLTDTLWTFSFTLL